MTSAQQGHVGARALTFHRRQDGRERGIGAFPIPDRDERVRLRQPFRCCIDIQLGGRGVLFRGADVGVVLHQAVGAGVRRFRVLHIRVSSSRFGFPRYGYEQRLAGCARLFADLFRERLRLPDMVHGGVFGMRLHGVARQGGLLENSDCHAGQPLREQGQPGHQECERHMQLHGEP